MSGGKTERPAEKAENILDVSGYHGWGNAKKHFSRRMSRRLWPQEKSPREPNLSHNWHFQEKKGLRRKAEIPFKIEMVPSGVN
jgi:hypothetical protein